MSAPKPQAKYDRYGRYLLDGKAYTRATTIAKCLEDTYHLNLWSQRNVVKGIGLRPDLYALAVATPVEDKDTLNSVCKQALDAASSGARANLGTALHSMTERVDRGESMASIAAPEPWASDIRAYCEKLDAANIEIVEEMIERVVVLDDLGIAGTFDRLVRVPGHDKPMIADLKTGGFLAWQSFAIQFAIYANADVMFDLSKGKRMDMPEVDKDVALVIHLPVGEARCELYLLDIKAGWEALHHAMWVRQWQKRKNLSKPLAV